MESASGCAESTEERRPVAGQRGCADPRRSPGGCPMAVAGSPAEGTAASSVQRESAEAATIFTVRVLRSTTGAPRIHTRPSPRGAGRSAHALAASRAEHAARERSRPRAVGRIEWRGSGQAIREAALHQRGIGAGQSVVHQHVLLFERTAAAASRLCAHTDLRRPRDADESRVGPQVETTRVADPLPKGLLERWLPHVISVLTFRGR